MSYKVLLKHFSLLFTTSFLFSAISSMVTDLLVILIGLSAVTTRPLATEAQTMIHSGFQQHWIHVRTDG